MAKETKQSRWTDATSKARLAFDELNEAVSTLADMVEAYQETLDNMPENLHGTPYYEKLSAVCELDFSMVEDLDGVISDAENADLPLGFGRD